MAINTNGPKDTIDKAPSQMNKVAQAVRQIGPNQPDHTDKSQVA